MWNGIAAPGLAANRAMAGAPSVCHAPEGVKQNCNEPDSLIVESRDERTSSRVTPTERAGFSDNAFGIPAKYAPRRDAYESGVATNQWRILCKPHLTNWWS